jgi:fermentation-respiration switch protein FrsA (DUF1100 family)
MFKKVVLSILLLFIVGLSLAYFLGGTFIKSYPSEIFPPPDSLPIQKVSFKSQSGALIHAWYLKGKDELGGVLLLHGIQSNRMQMQSRAQFLYQAGYSVLLLDFQAHGESLANYATFGYLEALDADAGYDFLHKKLYQKSIGVIGFSLGGAAILLGNVAKKAKALVLESVYPTIDEAISNRLLKRFGRFNHTISQILLWQIKPRLGFDAIQLRPIEYTQKIAGSTLVIVGEKDKLVTFKESKRFYSSIKANKSFWSLPNAGHSNFHHLYPKKYEDKIITFFRKHL